MLLKKLELSNYRNFKKKLFKFANNTTVIVGPNASGKTNILEAIYLLSTGKSFRAKIEEEMINYDEEVARVGGLVETIQSESVKLEAVLTRGEITVGENPKKVERVSRKRLKLNGLPKRLIDFSGNLKVTLFAPHHLDLVTESPSQRRDFLDFVLSQVDREYRRASLSYTKGLRQRNKLLLRIREEGLSRTQLMFWNQLLIKNGNYITEKRENLIDFVNEQKPLNEQKFLLDYDRSTISEARLEQYKDEEIAAATTLVGPHRDDFIFMAKEIKEVEDRDLARFGSRGEQRMGVLWLKLAELEYVEKITRQKPILLLDDIFSELDHEHRGIVIDVANNQQTIITTADPHFVEGMKDVEKIALTS